MKPADNKAAAGTEGAQAPSALMSEAELLLAARIGRTTARRLFADRGNHTEAHLSEAELAEQCTAAVGACLVMLREHAEKMRAEQAAPLGVDSIQIIELHIPDLEHHIFKRPVLIHVGKDGTLHALDRKAMTEPVLLERLMPVFSTETMEQAMQMITVFGRLQYREHPKFPGKPWYVLHRLPDGSMLSNRAPATLQVRDLPEITKMFSTWFDANFKTTEAASGS